MLGQIAWALVLIWLRLCCYTDELFSKAKDKKSKAVKKEYCALDRIEGTSW